MEENNFQETQHREEENNKANSIIKPRDVKGIVIVIIVKQRMRKNSCLTFLNFFKKLLYYNKK